MVDFAEYLPRLAALLLLAPVGVWAAQSAAHWEAVAPRPEPLRPSAPLLAVCAVLHLSAGLMIEPFWLALASLPLLWALIALAWIDAKRFLLPDFLTLPLIPAGLLVAWGEGGAAPLDEVMGAGLGLLIFAGFSSLYRVLRGREGLGLGDAKLLAAGGAWVGWAGLASVVLCAALIALGFLLFERLVGRPRAADDPVPFGPFLAAGIWLVWALGPVFFN